MKNVLKEYISFLLEKSRYKKEKVDLPSKLSVLEKYKNDPYVLVHFSELNKLGINPKTSYDTPVGIYGYNLKVLYDNILNNRLDFASDRKFMHVFRIKPEFQDKTIVVSKNCDTEDEEHWRDRLKKIFTTGEKNDFKKFVIDSLNLYNQVVDYIENSSIIIWEEKLIYLVKELKTLLKILEKALSKSDINYEKNKFIATIFISLNEEIVNAMEIIKNEIEKDTKLKIYYKLIDKKLPFLKDLITKDGFVKFSFEGEFNKDNYLKLKDTWFKTPFGYFYNACRLIGKDALGWNKVLRQQGISAVIDNGCGMIHRNEPAQGVVLSGQFIEHLETIENPYSDKTELPEAIKMEKVLNFVKKIKKLSSSGLKNNTDFFKKNYNLLANNLDYYINAYGPESDVLKFIFSNKDFVFNVIKENKHKDLYESIYVSIKHYYKKNDLTKEEIKILLSSKIPNIYHIKNFISSSTIYFLLRNPYLTEYQMTELITILFTDYKDKFDTYKNLIKKMDIYKTSEQVRTFLNKYEKSFKEKKSNFSKK